MEFVNYNGQLISKERFEKDYAFLKNEFGLIETYLIASGILWLSSLHYERILKSMHQLDFDVPDFFTEDFLENELKFLGKKNQHDVIGKIRLSIVWHQKQFHYFIESSSLAKQDIVWNDKGYILNIYQKEKKQLTAHHNLKLNQRSLYNQAIAFAKANHSEDAIIINEENKIIETAIANIFWIKNNQVFTPSLKDGCVDGVTRKFLIEKMKSAGIPFQEKILTKEMLLQADEVFITNAVRKIKWVFEIEDFRYNNSFVMENIYPLIT